MRINLKCSWKIICGALIWCFQVSCTTTVAEEKDAYQENKENYFDEIAYVVNDYSNEILGWDSLDYIISDDSIHKVLIDEMGEGYIDSLKSVFERCSELNLIGINPINQEFFEIRGGAWGSVYLPYKDVWFASVVFMSEEYENVILNRAYFPAGNINESLQIKLSKITSENKYSDSYTRVDINNEEGVISLVQDSMIYGADYVDFEIRDKIIDYLYHSNDSSQVVHVDFNLVAKKEDTSINLIGSVVPLSITLSGNARVIELAKYEMIDSVRHDFGSSYVSLCVKNKQKGFWNANDQKGVLIKKENWIEFYGVNEISRKSLLSGKNHRPISI